MTGLHGYPRPQLKRAEWISLDGEWEFSLDPDAAYKGPDDVPFDQRIRVPFAPETTASGIGFTGFFRGCWYRLTFEAPSLAPGDRLLLHFGAVDYSATVWINGHGAATHEGGYTPFTVEINGFLNSEGPQT
ncbi:MAG: glycoside hydrolase family 2, sugar binding, partial [Candidatus Solibacter sp.]|nr:glycoside hydrolase family 2, sugar binding [Candidatus Solibacter sp.]